MRQVGVIAAAGLGGPGGGAKATHLGITKTRKILAQGLARIPGIQIDPSKSSDQYRDLRCAGNQAKLRRVSRNDRSAPSSRVPVDAERIRMVTHLDVDRSDVEAAVGIIAEALRCRS